MFLQRAKIGYVCWMCSKDTLNFESDTELELCAACDTAYLNDYRRQVEERLRENTVRIEDDEGDLIATADLKIRIRSFKVLLSFIDWLNEHVGKGKWVMPINPVKEMINNNGRTTTHFQLFVPYKSVSMEWKSKWGEELELVSWSGMPKNTEDYRYKGGYEAVLAASKPKLPNPFKNPEKRLYLEDGVDDEYFMEIFGEI